MRSSSWLRLRPFWFRPWFSVNAHTTRLDALPRCRDRNGGEIPGPGRNRSATTHRSSANVASTPPQRPRPGVSAAAAVPRHRLGRPRASARPVVELRSGSWMKARAHPPPSPRVCCLPHGLSLESADGTLCVAIPRVGVTTPGESSNSRGSSRLRASRLDLPLGRRSNARPYMLMPSLLVSPHTMAFQAPSAPGLKHHSDDLLHPTPAAVHQLQPCRS